MRISVIIPCFNAEEHLGQAIGSALSQTCRPADVIVIDDGSTDGSRAVAESFAPAVRVVTRRSGNAPETRNHGASLATGDALMFLDADDVLGPRALEALAAEVRRHPGCVAACSWYRLERIEGRWVRQPPSCRPRRPDQDPLDAWLRGWYHPPCSVLWSRAAYDRTGGWDPRAKASNNDGDLMMRALILGIPLRLTSNGRAFYRRLEQPGESLSGKRRTEEGLRSRIGVVRRVAERLEAKNEVGRYREALDVACGYIIDDCGDRHPELLAECRGLRRRYGLPPWRRLARGTSDHLRSVLVRLWRTVAGSHSIRPSPPTRLEEIRYGLEPCTAPAVSERVQRRHP